MSAARKLQTSKSRMRKSSPAPAVSFDVPGDTDDALDNMIGPVLIINPNGTDEALLSSAKARARRLERTLEAWSLGDRHEVPAGELAKFLHATAFEVAGMLDEMWRRSLPKSARATR